MLCRKLMKGIFGFVRRNQGVFIKYLESIWFIKFNKEIEGEIDRF